MYYRNYHELSSLTPSIGQIYYMNFHSCENGQLGWRPGIVCQNNIGNLYSPNILAIPLTTVLKRIEMPTHVILDHPECGLRPSMALCENLHYLSKDDIGRYITTLPDEDMRNIAKATMMATGLIAYIPVSELEHVWASAVKLNTVNRYFS